jgi:hypothetical protein
MSLSSGDAPGRDESTPLETDERQSTEGDSSRLPGLLAVAFYLRAVHVGVGTPPFHELETCDFEFIDAGLAITFARWEGHSMSESANGPVKRSFSPAAIFTGFTPGSELVVLRHNVELHELSHDFRGTDVTVIPLADIASVDTRTWGPLEGIALVIEDAAGLHYRFLAQTAEEASRARDAIMSLTTEGKAD